MEQTNKWADNALADRFNTHKPIDEIHPDAAVNIYVGWPVFLEQLKYQSDFLGKERLNVLDFGCGAGDLCNRMYNNKHTTVGVDNSEIMLECAKNNSPSAIRYIHNDGFSIGTSGELEKESFDVITSMHAFDWIKDIASVVQELTMLLATNGVLLFSVFPKGHVVESLEIEDLFEDFDSTTDPTEGVCNFDGIKVPVYIRNPQYFDDLLSKQGFMKILEFLPQYPKAFLEKYNWTGALHPEMLILGYRKLP